MGYFVNSLKPWFMDFNKIKNPVSNNSTVALYKDLYNAGSKKGESGGSFLFGKPENQYQQSLLNPAQQSLAGQRNQAFNAPGNQSSFGTTTDYYRDLLSKNSQNFNDVAAPEIRNYNENILPDIQEQFAGMGSGAISSSGFRNATLRAGADLSERLGTLRDQMRMQGAQGLQNQGQSALSQQTENIIRPATGGFMQAYAGLAGNLLGNYMGGYMNKGMGGA